MTKLSARAAVTLPINPESIVHVVDPANTTQDPGGSSFKGALKDIVIPNYHYSYVIPPLTDNAVTNGENLHVAYFQALSLTPNGAALSANNRAAVLLLPGVYDLTTYDTLSMNTDFVDIIGWDKHSCIIRHNGAVVLEVTGDDIKIKNLTILNTSSTSTDCCYDSNGKGPTIHIEKVLLLAPNGAALTKSGTDYDGYFDDFEIGPNGLAFGNGGSKVVGLRANNKPLAIRMTTTDNTPVKVLDIPIPEHCAFKLEYEVYAKRQDNTDTDCGLEQGFQMGRRENGNITIPLQTINSSLSAVALLVDKNDTTDSMYIQVTGVAAETWSWLVIAKLTVHEVDVP